MDKTGTYDRLILTLSQKLGQSQEAFRYLEKSRSRAFLDLLGSNQRFFSEGEVTASLNFAETIETIQNGE